MAELFKPLFFISFLLLHPVNSEETIRLESLNESSGLVPFKLGPTKIVSHYHSFLQTVDLTHLNTIITSIEAQLQEFTIEFHKKTSNFFDPHVKYLQSKLLNILQQLKTFELETDNTDNLHKKQNYRMKRGLINGLGSIVKAITGNLDQDDADHYNMAIQELRDSSDKMAAEINNHVSLTKDWSSKYSKIIDNIVENQEKIKDFINYINGTYENSEQQVLKYSHLTQLLLILDDNVDSVAHELYKLENVFGFIRTSTVHHSMLKNADIKEMVDNLTKLYGNNQILDLNTREYFDVIKVGSYYVGNEIVIVYKFPIIQPYNYELYKLSPVPNKRQEAIIPPKPYLILGQRYSFYDEKECTKTSKFYICDDKTLQELNSDCVQELIINKTRHPSCKPINVTLKKAAYEKLDDVHYTISFPEPTKILLSCRRNNLNTVANGSYLLILPKNCYLKTEEFTLINVKNRVNGLVSKIIGTSRINVSDVDKMAPKITLNSIKLDDLHDLSTKISLEQPVSPTKWTDYSIYHTTVPLYVFIVGFSACVLAILYRNRRVHRKIDHNCCSDSY